MEILEEIPDKVTFEQIEFQYMCGAILRAPCPWNGERTHELFVAVFNTEPEAFRQRLNELFQLEMESFEGNEQEYMMFCMRLKWLYQLICHKQQLCHGVYLFDVAWSYLHRNYFVEVIPIEPIDEEEFDEQGFASTASDSEQPSDSDGEGETARAEDRAQP